MKRLAGHIDALNERIGRAVSWLALLIVLIQFGVVVGRYVFGVGSIWVQELITYMFGFMFMLGAAYTLRHDGHVRVDIFYREARPRTKAIVNLVGSVVFLIPICALIFWIAWPYVLQSWQILERSQESSGIPARYLQKTAILAFAVLMALQGLSMAIHSVLALRGDERELDASDERGTRR
jgi:TRAP-type mannitol/chloroaromatic compound transport system permease small subunit